MSDMAQVPWSGGAFDPPPGRVLVAGDWHGDRDWALSVISVFLSCWPVSRRG